MCRRLFIVRTVVVYREVLLLPSPLRETVPAQRSDSSSRLRESERRESEGGTESAKVAPSAVQGTAVSVLRSAFVRSEPKQRQGRDCMRSVCHRLGEELNLRVSRRSAEGVTEP